MNQKKLKSAIAKLVKSVMGPRMIEVGEFALIKGDKTSFNLDELGDPNGNDLSDPGKLWDRTTVLPENGLVDLYLYTHGFQGELDTNLLVRIKDAKVVQIFENSEDPRNEIPLVARSPFDLTPFTVKEARQFLGISEEDIPPVRTFLAVTKDSNCQPVTLMSHAWFDVSDLASGCANSKRVMGLELKDRQSVHVSGTGWCDLIGEVS